MLKNSNQLTSQNIRNTLFFLSLLDEFHKYKGLDYLLKALILVKKVIPDVKLIVGGKGSLLDYYRNMVVDYDLEIMLNFMDLFPMTKL